MNAKMPVGPVIFLEARKRLRTIVVRNLVATLTMPQLALYWRKEAKNLTKSIRVIPNTGMTSQDQSARMHAVLGRWMPTKDQSQKVQTPSTKMHVVKSIRPPSNPRVVMERKMAAAARIDESVDKLVDPISRLHSRSTPHI